MFGSMFGKSPPPPAPPPSEEPSSPTTTFREVPVARPNPADRPRFELTGDKRNEVVNLLTPLRGEDRREERNAAVKSIICPGVYAKTHAFVYDVIDGKESYSCVPNTKIGSYYEASKKHRCVPGFKNPPSFQPDMPKPKNPENTICMKMSSSGGRRTRHKKRKVRKGKSRKYRRY